MPVHIQITDPNGQRHSRLLTGAPLSLGRSPDNDLSFPEDIGLSRRHLVVEQTGGAWQVRDLGSKNGTVVNDQRVTGAVRLKQGDRIQASRVTLVIGETALPSSMGTVVFEAARPDPGMTAAHTVTLGQLVAGGGAPPEGATKGAERLWTDPVTALVRAGRELVARKPVEQLFADLLDLSMEAVGASRGVLLTLDRGELCVSASRGENFHISQAVRDRVIEQRQSMLVGDVMSDDILRARKSIVMQRVKSLMAAPLQTDERVLGLIYVDSPLAWRPFEAGDLNLLTVIANVAAMRIERDRLEQVEQARLMMERELEQAAEIQRQLLPLAAPSLAGLELAGYNRPCHGVGGDYYDFVTYPDGRVLVVLGDVAGKGMPAALLMVNLQARLRILAENPPPPAEMVSILNRAMAAVCPGNRFVTFFLSVMDGNAGSIEFCNAGHNPPMLVSKMGGLRSLEGGGPVLGILPNLAYQQRRVELAPGDTVVLYSDGVTEATNPSGDEFGEQRLADLLMGLRAAPAGELIRAINEELEAFAAGAPPADDVTIVVARRLE